MDLAGYKSYMKKIKKSQRTIERYSEFISEYLTFLEGRNIQIDEATPQYLQEFIDFGESKFHPFSHYLASIFTYYEYTGNYRMNWALEELDYGYLEFELAKFNGIEKEHYEKLNKNDIWTTKHLRDKGINHKLRISLSDSTGIPLEEIEGLVKLADLSRVFGAKVRCKLYFDAGFDTLDKIASMDHLVFRSKIVDYIKETGIENIPPTPKEAYYAVHASKQRPKQVTF